MQNLTDSKYWTDRHEDESHAYSEEKIQNIEFLFPILDSFFLHKGKKSNSTFELGCVPGQGLVKFCRRYDCTPFGADFSDQIHAMNKVVRKEFPKSKFYRKDLGSGSVKKYGTFDIVQSHGFIEHFSDIKKVLKTHIDLLAKDGTLLLTTPNLSKFRAAYWRIFDNQLYYAHNPQATHIDEIKILLNELGLEVVESGYFGKPHFWIENTSSLSNRIGSIVTVVTNFILSKIDLKNSITMPFVYWIAREKKD